jgi:hypothetical protein
MIKKSLLDSSKDLINFFQNGTLKGFTPGNTKSDLMNRLGKPEYIEEYRNGFYYFHYGDIRFGIDKDIITEIDIILSSDTDLAFENTYDFDFSFSKSMKLNHVFILLSTFGLKYEIDDKWSNRECLIIIVNKIMKIYYDLYKNEILKIECVQP